MSLRLRLSLIISLLFVAGSLLGGGLQISTAKNRVSSEIESTAELTRLLLASLLPAGQLSHEEALLLVRQLQSLDDIRHMDISLRSDRASSLAWESEEDPIRAPGWFIRMVRPEAQTYALPLSNGAGDAIVIHTNPSHEIEEVWVESRNSLLVLVSVMLVLNLLLYVIIGYWLRPVRAIVHRLDEAEQGDFSHQVPEASLPELRLIARHLNQLTRVLRRSQAENERLTQRSLMIQEEERRALAQELHDEMGQSLSAIKAIAFSLRQQAPAGSVTDTGGRNIEQIAARISDHVRALMGRLRPANLDELGLAKALQQMVDDWNTHHDCFCRLQVNEQLDVDDEAQRIHLYRIVQEALTNVARHARAQRVELQLVELPGQLQVTIRDNGQGFDPETTERGMGLRGMEERVQAMQGEWQLQAAPGKGVTILLCVPQHNTRNRDTEHA